MIVLGYSHAHLQLYKGSMSRGKFTQELFLEEAVSENLIVNGIIQNVEEYAVTINALLRKGRIDDKEVTVIIDSSSIVYRDIRVPKLNNKEIKNFVYHTFDVQLPNINDYVIDYMLVEENKLGKRIIGIAIPTMVVDSYKEAVLKAGLKPKNATTSIYSLIKMNIIYKSKNNISLYNNGDVLSCVIFNNTTYDFSNVTRLVNKQEPEREILQRIDQIVQFEKVQASDYSYDLIYGLGIDIERLKMYDATLRLSNALNTRYVNANVDSNALLYAVMYANSEAKQINLFKGINQSAKSNDRYTRNLLLALFCNFLIICGIGVYKYFEYSSLINEQKALEARFNEPIFYDHYSTATRFLELNRTIEAEVNAYQSATSFVESNAPFTYNTFANIFNLADDVRVLGYAYANNTLVLNAVGSNKNAPYEFAQALEKSGMFESVDYTGYSYNETEKSYSFIVTILLKKEGE
ncbi:MAG: hypothetical protein IKM20_07570 [Erysipelotrichales bacterium]|nr:hypothetical protein [Erysipelotrichales bacterium]